MEINSELIRSLFAGEPSRQDGEIANVQDFIRHTALLLAEQDASPCVLIISHTVGRRLIEIQAYVDRVGAQVAYLNEKTRARLVTRHSRGRHAHKTTRRERRLAEKKAQQA